MNKYEEAEAVHLAAAERLSEHRKTVGIHYMWTFYPECDYTLEQFQARVLETLKPQIDAELEVMAEQVLIMNEHRHLKEA
jgi:hypothetical protein